MSFLWLLSCLIGATGRHSVNNGASPKTCSMLTVTAVHRVLPRRGQDNTAFLFLLNTYAMLQTLFCIWQAELVVMVMLQPCLYITQHLKKKKKIFKEITLTGFLVVLLCHTDYFLSSHCIFVSSVNSLAHIATCYIPHKIKLRTRPASA